MKIIFALLLSFFIVFSNNTFAGVKTKLFIAGGSVAVKKVLTSPKARNAIIKKAQSNPAFKEKAKSILVKFMKNPKNAKYKDSAKDFYKDIVGLPKKINGRIPINAKYAGKTLHFTGKLKSKYPHGIPYNTQGYPDFSRYVIKKIDLKNGFKGRTKDFSLADKISGISKQYRKDNKLTWHHHENGRTMQLIKRELHEAARHNGGISTTK